MTYSRVQKYQELRDGLKEEAGIKRETTTSTEAEVEEDDFLAFMNKDEDTKKTTINLDDTLTEAKTFEQMQEESSEELKQALRSAKKGVGKSSKYNTRMDILAKIKESEQPTIKLDSVDQYETKEFAKGVFINSETPDKPETTISENMTLMEKLAAISPEEDAKKAQEYLAEDSQEEKQELEDVTENKVVTESEPEEIQKIAEEETLESKEDVTIPKEQRSVKAPKTKNNLLENVLDVLIVILVVIFVILFGMIIYQSFF